MNKVSSDLSTKFANMSFVCACLVVFIHVGIEPNHGTVLWWVAQMFTDVGVTRIAVPFFFLAAGYFIAVHVDEDGWYKKEVLKRVRTLYVPYILWNVVYLAYAKILSVVALKVGVETHIAMPKISTFIDIVNALGLNPCHRCAHGHLWFLRCLFYFAILSPVAVRIAKHTRMSWGLVGLFLAAGVPMSFLEDGSFWYRFFNWNFSLEGWVAFVCGIAFRLYSGSIIKKWQWDNKIVGVNALTVGLGLFVVRASLVYVGVNTVLNYWLTYIATPILMLAVWCSIPYKRAFGGFVNYSFPIYILHQFVLVAVAGFVGAIGLREYVIKESVLLYFGRGFLVVCTIVVFMRYIIAHFPRISILLFGGRVR